MKKITLIIISLLFINLSNSQSENSEKLYQKIDLFGEVLEKIKKEYVNDVDQSKIMDSAINGVLQSLDPYSSYMSPELFENMKTDTKGEFGGLGIEIGMESGVVKVISPIDDTPASEAGIKAGDYIVKIDGVQVQGKSLMESVKLMRGPVNTKINLTVRRKGEKKALEFTIERKIIEVKSCLLYTSDAADEKDSVDLGGRRIIKKTFFQAEDGIRDRSPSRGLGDVYKRQI